MPSRPFLTFPSSKTCKSTSSSGETRDRNRSPSHKPESNLQNDGEIIPVSSQSSSSLRSASIKTDVSPEPKEEWTGGIE